MRGWSFPSNQKEGKKPTFMSGFSISTKLVQMNQNLSFFEEQVQFETDCLEFQGKSPRDLNLSDISDQSSSMGGMAAWAGAESSLKSESLIALTSILKHGIATDNRSGGDCTRRKENLISETTMFSSLPQSMLGAAEVSDPEAPGLELSSGRVHQQVNGDGVVLQVVLQEENPKWPQIKGRAVSALFWLLKKMSKSDNRRQL